MEPQTEAALSLLSFRVAGTHPRIGAAEDGTGAPLPGADRAAAHRPSRRRPLLGGSPPGLLAPLCHHVTFLQEVSPCTIYGYHSLTGHPKALLGARPCGAQAGDTEGTRPGPQPEGTQTDTLMIICTRERGAALRCPTCHVGSHEVTQSYLRVRGPMLGGIRRDGGEGCPLSWLRKAPVGGDPD